MSSIGVRLLRHGTTRQRALAIERHGPDANFTEPGGLDPARGLSACPDHGPFPCGTPEQYAAGKAAQFPLEGGPAIVEFAVPEEIIDLAIDAGGEIRFEPGYGMTELCQAWPTLAKRIVWTHR